MTVDKMTRQNAHKQNDNRLDDKSVDEIYLETQKQKPQMTCCQLLEILAKLLDFLMNGPILFAVLPQ